MLVVHLLPDFREYPVTHDVRNKDATVLTNEFKELLCRRAKLSSQAERSSRRHGLTRDNFKRITNLISQRLNHRDLILVLIERADFRRNRINRMRRLENIAIHCILHQVLQIHLPARLEQVKRPHAQCHEEAVHKFVDTDLQRDQHFRIPKPKPTTWILAHVDLFVWKILRFRDFGKQRLVRSSWFKPRDDRHDVLVLRTRGFRRLTFLRVLRGHRLQVIG